MRPDKVIEEEMYKKAREFIPKKHQKGWGSVKEGNYAYI